MLEFCLVSMLLNLSGLSSPNPPAQVGFYSLIDRRLSAVLTKNNKPIFESGKQDGATAEREAAQGGDDGECQGFVFLLRACACLRACADIFLQSDALNVGHAQSAFRGSVACLISSNQYAHRIADYANCGGRRGDPKIVSDPIYCATTCRRISRRRWRSI